MLLAVAIGLVVYPLWGILSPDSYAQTELKHHYALDENTSLQQVISAAFWLYLSNLPLALGLVAFSRYLLRPSKFKWALFGGLAILLFPVFRVASHILMDLQLTSHLSSAAVAISFSAEELLTMLLGALLLVVASIHREDI